MIRPSEPRVVEGALIEAIRGELGLVFPEGRQRSLATGIARALDALGERDALGLAQRIRDRDEVAIAVVAAELTVGETYFFRDAVHFELLRRHVLDGARHVRMWSAGCSSGEEPYSLVIAALEAGVVPDVVATDLNPAALRRARAGLYGAWSFRGVSDEIRRKWFHTEGRHSRVHDEVKRHVRFETGNLLDSERGPRGMHAVFCRNVLIYFDGPAIAAAARTLRDALLPEGWLFTGPSDPMLELEGLRIDTLPGAIIHRRSERNEAPRPVPVAAIPIAPRRRRTPAPSPPSAPNPIPRGAPAPIPRGAPHPIPRGASAPTSSDALAAVRASIHEKDFDRALAQLDDLLRTPSLETEPWMLRATLRLDRGDDSGALSDLRRALLLDRELTIALILSAGALRRLGDHAAADKMLARAGMATVRGKR